MIVFPDVSLIVTWGAVVNASPEIRPADAVVSCSVAAEPITGVRAVVTEVTPALEKVSVYSVPGVPATVRSVPNVATPLAKVVVVVPPRVPPVEIETDAVEVESDVTTFP